VLDEEEGAGDGSPMDALVLCPYCGEPIELFVDDGGAPVEEYVEDCQVCCRPMQVVVAANEDGDRFPSVRRLDD
jgi:hypothetical protein